MRLYNVYGNLVYKNVTKYKIDWDGKCRSKCQFAVKQFLKNYWQTHLTYEEFPVYGTLLKCDLLNFTKKIAVETQGRQHDSYVEHFMKSRSGYLSAIKRDVKKAQWLEKNGFQIVEIYEDEVKNLSKQFFLEKFDIKL